MALTQHDFERAQEITGYEFRDIRLLREALQSPIKDRDEATGEIHESDGNRRLAKLGFVVLELAITDEWIRRDRSHRDLDELRKTFLSRNHLCDVAQQIGLQGCFSMSQRQENIAAPPTTMKLVLSAVIGAVWLDAGADSNEGLRQVKVVLQTFGFFDWAFLDYVD